MQTAPSGSNATSNLALTFFSLPQKQREAISTFYSFCREVDDIADSSLISAQERATALADWRSALTAPSENEPSLAPQIRDLLANYRIPHQLLLEIIEGCEMDLVPARYATWNDLAQYCHRVASVVGLVSIEIFGYSHPGCKEYALQLGLALQLTNILRDVGEDYANGKRVYLPTEELQQFGCTESDIADRRHTPAFVALMRFQAERADALFEKARTALPRCDRRSMVAAEMMRRIYQALLSKIRRHQFQVLDRRLRLNRLQKACCIARTFLAHAIDPSS
jgi:phytoene synthase